MRLLVLDGSKVLVNLVERLVPEGVEVESTDSFDQAIDALISRAPDAAIVDVTPAELPWGRFQDLCSQHEPPIPVLYESCVFERPEEAGIETLSEGSHFLAKPYHAEELRLGIQQLLKAVESGGMHRTIRAPAPAVGGES